MLFNEFKLKVEALARIPLGNMFNIQDLICEYYGKLGSIEFDCNNMFVVRASPNDERKLFENIERCSYNPYPSKIPLQRGNYPEQQVFYCSMYTDTDAAFTSLTCIMETALEQIKNHKIKKCYYTLSRWDLKRPLKLWVLPFSKLSHKQNKAFKMMKDELFIMLKNHPNKEEIMNAYKYMSEVFCKRNNRMLYYKISSAFFNFLLQTEHSCDGLAYPSANTYRAGINVVLKKELVDLNLLECTSATLYVLKRNKDDKTKLSILPCSMNAKPDTRGKLNFEIAEDVHKDFI